MHVLVLGLGNEFAGDDAIGVLAVRALGGAVPPAVDVVESAGSGLALLEIFTGYERAVVVDSIRTGRHRPGTVLELGIAGVGPVRAASLHHTGLPELAAVARRAGLSFPGRTSIFAVEIEAAPTFGAPLSAPVAGALARLVPRVRARLDEWT